jgi:uncharacterized protein YprB with RNaseH-like and TPR domain
MVTQCHFDFGHPSRRLALIDTPDQLGDLEREEQLHFDRKKSSVPSIINRIKAEASLWVVAGAKDLAFLLVRE